MEEQGIRILVADDERIERLILCRKLAKELGEEVGILQAENGREAIRLFEEERPQIVIMDIAMPGIDGIQAAARIRELDGGCILIFLTAYSDFNYSVKAIRLHAMDYLTKPYDDEELLAVVETAVHQARGRMERVSEAGERSGEKPEAAAREPQGDSAQISQPVLREIQTFIAQNYMHDISMQDAARYMNYADTYFCRLFKQGFGSNFTAYLTKYRIREAVRLLETTSLSVKEIGQRTGYADANYFAKVFKRQTGVVPSEYRN